MEQSREVRYLILSLLVLLLFEPAFGEPWSDYRFEIIPGESVGPIVLGEPLSEKVYEELGRPSETMENTAVWGVVESFELVRGLSVALESGRVKSVELNNVRAVTNRGVYLGMSTVEARKRYPKSIAQWSDFYDATILKVPGLTMIGYPKGKVFIMNVNNE